MRGNILIASTSLDKVNFGTVARYLEELNFNVIIYETDKIANVSTGFEARIKNGKLQFKYGQKVINPAKIDAAWYRKPMYYGQNMDQLRWLSLKDEYMAAHNNFLAAIPEKVWLNNPTKMSRAEVKLPQLSTAFSVGFNVPETVVTNAWEDVEKLNNELLIVKMAKSGLVPSKDGKVQNIMHTAMLNRKDLPMHALPYPGIWQPYINKKREWRVTVVGDKVFSAAIYTKEKAKDDWRKHQFSKSLVEFKAEPFPKDLQQKCLALLKRYNLRYGAFDFIETPEGEIIFLEVNPNGQFMWLEDELGLPISKAIANELIAIAEQN